MSESKSVYDMEDTELTDEIHTKLAALDEALSTVFKSHVPFRDEANTLTPLEHSVEIMRNLESTLDSLRNVNPLSLVKQLMGMG